VRERECGVIYTSRGLNSNALSRSVGFVKRTLPQIKRRSIIQARDLLASFSPLTAHVFRLAVWPGWLAGLDPGVGLDGKSNFVCEETAFSHLFPCEAVILGPPGKAKG